MAKILVADDEADLEMLIKHERASAFVASIIEQPTLYSRGNVGISKPTMP